MPATHPFAIKLENAIEHAKRVRDALLAAKNRAGEQEAEVDRSKKKKHPYRFVQLGAIAASGMERQADVSEGEAFNSKPDPKNADKILRYLKIRLAQEESRCAQMRAIANRDAGRTVSMPCPGVTAAREAIERYVASQFGRIGVGAHSGGGGGGGW